MQRGRRHGITQEERKIKTGGSKGKMMFSYAWLGLWKEHVFPNIAMRPEDMVFSSRRTKFPWMKTSWKAINQSASTWFMLFVYDCKCKQLPEFIFMWTCLHCQPKGLPLCGLYTCNQHSPPRFNTWTAYERWSLTRRSSKLCNSSFLSPPHSMASVFRRNVVYTAVPMPIILFL